MTKIKFNCPSCQAKLKVPANLAGVAGPCPKCGGTIVAPLKSEESPPTAKPEPATAVPQQKPTPAVSVTASTIPSKPAPPRRVPTPSAQTTMPAGGFSQPASAAATAVAEPPVRQQPKPQAAPVIQQPVTSAPPVTQRPPVEAPPVIQQPVQQQSHVQQPQQTPVPSNQVGFPRSFEQVSHTAAVALQNSPVPGNYSQGPVNPGSWHPNPPQTSQPAPATQQPQQPAPSNYQPAPPQQPVEPADMMPTDVFDEPPTTEFDPHANQYGEVAPQSEPHEEMAAQNNAYVPNTEPIVMKRRQNEPVARETNDKTPGPRLDASLGDAPGADTLSPGYAAAGNDPTIIQLPEVGDENPGDVEINPPPTARPEYRPPNPVSLAPPGTEVEPEAEIQQFEEQELEDYEQPQEEFSYDVDVEPEFPVDELDLDSVGQHSTAIAEPDLDDEDDNTDNGSVAAFLAEAMEAGANDSGKSKDEILDELLGVAPKQKKKKGLSGSTKFMLAVLASVAVCAALGVYWGFDKLGGFGVSGENVFGDQGLKNLEAKTGGVAISKITRPEETKSAAADLPEIPRVEDTEAPPEKIEIPDIKSEVNNAVAAIGDAASETVDAANDKVSELANNLNSQVPEIEPVKPIVPNPPAPSPLPDVQKKNYNPPPFFPAPGPDDPPLKNTHDLVDAFMRAPNWERRLPYIYKGDSIRSQIAQYYQQWPDFSVDRFKMKLFQMELEEEFGGPFWVYQISMSDADPGGVPMIIRVEGGNLKVDWKVYSEFSDEHYVKFREGKIPAPATFRLVAERVSEYPGADKPGFKDLDQYLCFEINPPYGGYRAYSEYAFVPKGTPIAETLDRKIGLGDEPLAVILTLDRKDFSHGIRHYVITDFVDEGWFN